MLQTLVTILVFAPLCGAIVAGLFGKRIGATASMALTTGLLFLSCVIAWRIFVGHVWGGEQNFLVELMPFIQVHEFVSTWSIRVDTLSAVMLVVVTTVSALVHLYSWGYMAEDPGKPRFFSYLSLFTFAMLALVTAEDFMQLFFGWEGVGLASYLLIGFWFHKESANAAAVKAFVVNRVGDFGFILGILTIFWMFHTIRFDQLFPQIAVARGDALVVPGTRLERARPRRLPAVRGRHGQVGPVLPAHLVAGRHGGPDPGLGPDPRRDHGDRGRLHGLPAVAAL